MVSIIEAEESNDESPDSTADIMAVEIVKGKVYSCPALRSPKGKEVKTSEGKIDYSFDISKADQIFDHLLKDKQIKLLDGHKIPSQEELKGKRYCKWHNSYNHATINCMVFRRAIQKGIEEGRFKLADKGISEMTVDTDPFPTMDINMVSFVRDCSPSRRSK